jgi:hypothetical protein
MKEREGRICHRCGNYCMWQEFSLPIKFAADETFYGWCRECVGLFYLENGPVTDTDACGATDV